MLSIYLYYNEIYFLLSCLVHNCQVRPLNLTEAALHQSKMDLVVSHIIRHGVDMRDSRVAVLVLRYLCSVRNDRLQSQVYLSRMHRLLGRVPGSLAVSEYAAVLCQESLFDVAGATYFHAYLLEIGARPLESVRRFSLHRCELNRIPFIGDDLSGIIRMTGFSVL